MRIILDTTFLCAPDVGNYEARATITERSDGSFDVFAYDHSRTWESDNAVSARAAIQERKTRSSAEKAARSMLKKQIAWSMGNDTASGRKFWKEHYGN